MIRLRRGEARSDAAPAPADEMVQWTISSDERAEHKRGAGRKHRRNPCRKIERVAGSESAICHQFTLRYPDRNAAFAETIYNFVQNSWQRHQAISSTYSD